MARSGDVTPVHRHVQRAGCRVSLQSRGPRRRYRLRCGFGCRLRCGFGRRLRCRLRRRFGCRLRRRFRRRFGCRLSRRFGRRFGCRLRRRFGCRLRRRFGCRLRRRFGRRLRRRFGCRLSRRLRCRFGRRLWRRFGCRLSRRLRCRFGRRLRRRFGRRLRRRLWRRFNLKPRCVGRAAARAVARLHPHHPFAIVADGDAGAGRLRLHTRVQRVARTCHPPANPVMARSGDAIPGHRHVQRAGCRVNPQSRGPRRRLRAAISARRTSPRQESPLRQGRGKAQREG